MLHSMMSWRLCSRNVAQKWHLFCSKGKAFLRDSKGIISVRPFVSLELNANQTFKKSVSEIIYETYILCLSRSVYRTKAVKIVLIWLLRITSHSDGSHLGLWILIIWRSAGDHYQISITTCMQHLELMVKVTLETTPEVIKMHHAVIVKPPKEWLYHFICLLLANAKPHLRLINYEREGPVEVLR